MIYGWGKTVVETYTEAKCKEKPLKEAEPHIHLEAFQSGLDHS